MAIAIVGAVFATCAKPVDPIVAEVESARDRTVPPAGRIVSSYPLQRDRGLARATWGIETEMAWSAYTEWVRPRLGEYRLVAQGRDRLLLSRQLEGDVYTLVLVEKPSSASLRIEASFEATPF